MNRIGRYFFPAVFLGILFGIPGAVSKYVKNYILDIPPNWPLIPFRFLNNPFFIRQMDVLDPLLNSVKEALFILFSFVVISKCLALFFARKDVKKDTWFDFCILGLFTALLWTIFYNANRYFIYSKFIFDINRTIIYAASIVSVILYYLFILRKNIRREGEGLRKEITACSFAAVPILFFVTQYVRVVVRKTTFSPIAHLLIIAIFSFILYAIAHKAVCILFLKVRPAIDKWCKACESFLISFSKGVAMFLGIALVALLGFEVFAFPGKRLPDYRTARTGQENVLLITIETTRSDHITSYGYSKKTTPFLDEFFSDKIIFTDASSTWPATVPSVTSLLTSRYFYWHKNNKEKPIETNVTFLQESLKKEGYRTAAFVANWVLEKKNRSLWRGFDVYDDEMPTWFILRNLMERNARDVNRKVFSWLSFNKDKPFFLWIHYNDPHGPYTPPGAFARKFDPKGYGKKDLVEISGDFYMEKNRIPKIQSIKNIKDTRYYVASYDAEINYTDYEIGKLLNFISEKGLLDNTIIIVTSDHGEALSGDYGYYFTHDIGITRDQVDVPLFMHIPGHSARRFRAPVSLISIFPTIMDLLNIKTDCPMDGDSLIRLMRRNRLFPNKDLYAYTEYAKGYGIKNARFRLIYNDGDKTLYDRRKDPGETVNVYEKYKNIDRVREMERLLKKFVAKAKKYHLEPRRATEESDDLKSKLKALGYLN